MGGYESSIPWNFAYFLRLNCDKLNGTEAKACKYKLLQLLNGYSKHIPRSMNVRCTMNELKASNEQSTGKNAVNNDDG